MHHQKSFSSLRSNGRGDDHCRYDRHAHEQSSLLWRLLQLHHVHSPRVVCHHPEQLLFPRRTIVIFLVNFSDTRVDAKQLSARCMLFTGQRLLGSAKFFVSRGEIRKAITLVLYFTSKQMRASERPTTAWTIITYTVHIQSE